MIYKEKPKTFNKRFEIVSCFVECNNEIILLHRQDHKSEGNTWGVPAGKIEEGETPHAAILRELNEETQIQMLPSNLSYFKKVYVKYPDYDFIYHIFHAIFKTEPNIIINPKEHKNFMWISPKNAFNIPLIQDLDNCIKLFYFNS